jgi:hypothetical protein
MMDRKEKMIVALAGCSHALTHGTMLIFPAVLLLLQKEFSLGYLRRAHEQYALGPIHTRGDEGDRLRHLLLPGLRIPFSGVKFFRVYCSELRIAVGLYGAKQQCLSSHPHRLLYSEDAALQTDSVITY